jgi:mannose-6-phosphate isomerase-like protein (cupin superfamily)
VERINLAEKLAAVAHPWQPHTVAEFNGHDLMVARFQGEFRWHAHDDTDDLFLVLRGRVTLQLRTGNVELGPGELFVVPRGVEHCPRSDDGAEVLLVERTGTPNTGDAATAEPRRVL